MAEVGGDMIVMAVDTQTDEVAMVGHGADEAAEGEEPDMTWVSI
jgi:hypothetical protein